MLEIQILSWDMHNDVGELNQLMGYQPWKWFARNQENMFWCIDMSMNCCFSELALKEKPNKHLGLVQSKDLLIKK
jgi:hypothetical protein